MPSPTVNRPGSAFEEMMREMNEALVVSSVRQHELVEQARDIEAALRKSESELRSQAEELARFNRLAVGREMRIIALKREMNERARRLGEPLPYRLELEDADGETSPFPATGGKNDISAMRAVSHDPVPLAGVLCNERLAQRPTRPPDYKAETSAYVSLMQTLVERPDSVFQVLADSILDALNADSAGLSLLSADGAEFYWPAIAGVWKPHIGGGTPRDFGPCGDVLDCDAPLLFADLERRYGYFRAVSPAVREALLVPFRVSGRAVGTLWAVFHGDRHFDAEDLRRLQSLGRFASVAYQSTQLHVSDKTRREAALNLMEDAVESRQEMERVNADLRALESKTHEQAASLAELNRRKDHFLAMLSHELRNPLASIRAATAVMRRRDDLDTIQMQAQEMIERQVSQLARLIDDLLEVSRISTGRIHLRLDRVDLRDIVHRAVQSMRQQTDQKGQSIEESLAEGPQWMQGDAARLEQIVVNLLSNASKYTDRGGRIVVGLQEDGDELVLRVKDTGVGISPELLPHIFELFMQVDESLDKSQGGLGLGLALVQSLVSLHRGRVEVFSTPGEGSEFLIRFPITASAATEIVPADPISAALDGLRVLVVDDNQDAAQSIGLLLETSGHSIRLAYNGPSALAEARSFTPDVVLLDIGLPVLSGFEVAKSIRMEPTLRDTVLVALTGYAQDSDRLRTREAGFDYHLVKPVDFESLDSILAAVAARRAGTSGLH